MDLFYFCSGGLVFGIALFKRELLIVNTSFKILLLISVVLFLVGLALHFTQAAQDSTSGALLSPLLSLALFRIFRRIFLQRFKREPCDTWFNWQVGMGADRVFNIVYFVSALFVWMFTTVGMIELAKAGL